MGLRNSRSMRILREEGWKILPYVGHKIIHKTESYLKRCDRFISYYLYPKLILTKQEYQVYKNWKKTFKQNYKDIIKLDSKFFRKNLKDHISWVSSEEFKRSLTNDFHVSSHASNKASCMQSNNTIVTPPPTVALRIILLFIQTHIQHKVNVFYLTYRRDIHRKNI